ncbi:hypothetical protein [Pseudomonas sp. NPDC088444]|uniref:hypothetical protein n=1 Tax=Pseudomonas sp. NPDC088444 TaxID=3364456 RepID=UPI00384FE553
MTDVMGQLFESIVARQRATVLPGRYGGDDDKDQLAFAMSGTSVTLLLGLKVFDDDGGFKLNTSDAGVLQYSPAWIEAVIDELKMSPSTMFEAVKIQETWDAGTLVAGVICFNSETQQVSVHRIAIR